MKKTLLSIALMAAASSTLANDSYHGRLSAMSGAGYATGGYADGVVFNPSLAAKFGERDDFALVGNFGAMAEDEDDLVDGFEDLTDYLDELEARTASDAYWMDEFGGVNPNDPDAVLNQAEQLQAEEAEEAIRRLEGIANKTANIGAGGSLVISLPNDWFSLAVVGKNRTEAAVVTVVDEQDYEYIRSFVGDTDFDPAGLTSYGIARGAAVSEVGLAIAKELETGDNSKLLLGATPKWMHVATFVYSSAIDDFDEDDFDGDDYTVEHDAVNVDLGATYMSGNMRYALTVANLISDEYETIIPNDQLELKPRATAAVGYESSWLTAEFAADLNTSPSFATGQDTRFVRAGIELDLASWVQFRGGLTRDLEDNVEDMVSVGFGLSPFNVVNVDVALFGEDLQALVDGDSYNGGASLQLGLRF